MAADFGPLPQTTEDTAPLNSTQRDIRSLVRANFAPRRTPLHRSRNNSLRHISVSVGGRIISHRPGHNRSVVNSTPRKHTMASRTPQSYTGILARTFARAPYATPRHPSTRQRSEPLRGEMVGGETEVPPPRTDHDGSKLKATEQRRS